MSAKINKHPIIDKHALIDMHALVDNGIIINDIIKYIYINILSEYTYMNTHIHSIYPHTCTMYMSICKYLVTNLEMCPKPSPHSSIITDIIEDY